MKQIHLFKKGFVIFLKSHCVFKKLKKNSILGNLILSILFSIIGSKRTTALHCTIVVFI